MTDRPIFDHANFDDDDFDPREHMTPRELLQEAMARAAVGAAYVDDFDDCA